MKVLVLNGSPHKAGHTMELVDALLSGIEISELKIVHAYDAKVKPCIDCRKCRERAGCVIPDEMQDIYEKLHWADCIIFASPMQFATWSAPLMAIISRFQTFWSARYIRREPVEFGKKCGALVMSSGTKWYGMFSSVQTSAQIAFDDLGAKFVGMAVNTRTDKQELGTLPQEALRQAAQLARDIAHFF